MNQGVAEQIGKLEGEINTLEGEIQDRKKRQDRLQKEISRWETGQRYDAMLAGMTDEEKSRLMQHIGADGISSGEHMGTPGVGPKA